MQRRTKALPEDEAAADRRAAAAELRHLAMCAEGLAGGEALADGPLKAVPDDCSELSATTLPSEEITNNAEAEQPGHAAGALAHYGACPGLPVRVASSARLCSKEEGPSSGSEVAHGEQLPNGASGAGDNDPGGGLRDGADPHLPELPDQAQEVLLLVRHAMSGEALMLVRARPTDTAAAVCEAVLRETGDFGVALQLLFRSQVLDSHTVLGTAGVSDGDELLLLQRPLRCLTASLDGTARIRHLQSGLQLLVGLGSQVRTAALAPRGSTLLLVSAGCLGSLWCAETGAPLGELEEEVLSCAFAPDGQTFAGPSEGFLARVWCAETGRCLRTLEGHADDVTAVAYSPDGRVVATACADGSAMLFTARSGHRLRHLVGHADTVQTVAFSPDGSLVVTASMDATARIWHVSTGDCLQVLAGHAKAVHSAAFSPDGGRVLTASFDGTAAIWDVAQGGCLLVLPGDGGVVRTATFSPDGSRVVLAAGSEVLRIFDSECGELCLTLTGHEDWVRAASFSPDGLLIASASYDGTARLWNSTSGHCLQVLGGHSGGVVSADLVLG